MKKRLLISGSSGFVGTNFIRRAPEFDIREVDLLITRVNEIDFSGVDTVLHLAAMVHQMKGGSEEEYFKINRDLALEMAIQSKSKGVKHFILLSTVKVYGESIFSGNILNEQSQCNPVDSYGKSKYEAEKAIKPLEDESFSVAIVRSPLVYGAGVKANMYNLIRLIDRYRILPLGKIKNKRSIVFVGNLVALLKHIINKKSGGLFIAGDASAISTTQLVNLIAENLNKKIWLIKTPDMILEIGRHIFPGIIDRIYGSLELDINHTNSILQYLPPYSCADGISEMVLWYRESREK